MPRGYSKIKYWNDLFTKEQADNLVNTLGNLTLLSGKKNVEASNRPFLEKIQIYEGKGIDGMTSYRITQELVDTIRQKKDWTSERILERRDKFIWEIGKIFEVDFNVIESIEESETEVSESTQELYNLLEEEILKINPEIKIEHKKHYIAFKKKGNFASIAIQSNNIKLWLYLNKEELIDTKNLTRNVSEIGHHGTGNTEVILNNKEDLSYVLGLIKQSYDNIEQSSEEEQEFDEKHVQEKMNPETYQLFNKFREELKKITHYEEKINKYFIGYKNGAYYFVTIAPRQNFFYINILDIDKSHVPSLSEGKAGYEERNKNVFIKIESENDIKIALPLMKFSRRYKND